MLPANAAASPTATSSSSVSKYTATDEQCQRLGETPVDTATPSAPPSAAKKNREDWKKWEVERCSLLRSLATKIAPYTDFQFSDDVWSAWARLDRAAALIEEAVRSGDWRPVDSALGAVTTGNNEAIRQLKSRANALLDRAPDQSAALSVRRAIGTHSHAIFVNAEIGKHYQREAVPLLRKDFARLVRLLDNSDLAGQPPAPSPSPGNTDSTPAHPLPRSSGTRAVRSTPSPLPRPIDTASAPSSPRRSGAPSSSAKGSERASTPRATSAAPTSQRTPEARAA